VREEKKGGRLGREGGREGENGGEVQDVEEWEK